MKPPADAKPRKLDLRILGMTCAGCVASVEKALRSVPGVSEASVNLMTESATVRLGDDSTRSRALVDAVRAAGYDAEAIPSRSKTGAAWADPAGYRETQRRNRQALIQAIGLTLPILGLDLFHHILWSHNDVGEVAPRLIQLILLAMLAVSPAGGPILAGGLRAVWHRTANMELLITMGFLVAFGSSLFGTFARQPAFIHFHAAAMILALVCVGRYFEATAKNRAAAAIAQMARRGDRIAMVQRGDSLVAVPAQEVAVGDRVRVAPHATIPVDGEVIEGEAAVDESLMTGEPMPVRHARGDHVMGGSIVVEGNLLIRATSEGGDALLDRIVRMITEAQTSRTAMQRLADRVAAVFTPAVLVAAVVTFAAWWLLGDASATAMRAAIAVLVVACPCALGLATPTVVLVASGQAALRGILVRDARMLEAMGAADTIVWDKTGTLTTGRPVVREVIPLGEMSQRELVRFTAAAEQLSPHPLAKAIVAQAHELGIALVEPRSFESTPGRGIKAIVDDRQVLVGSESFVTSQGVPIRQIVEIARQRRGSGDTVSIVAIDSQAAGAFLLADDVRRESAKAIDRLRTLGMESELLTGDDESAARSVAAALGIERVKAGVDPEGKANYVKSLRLEGRVVAMVGDGVNDAPALASADAGIAFASGADLASDAAGIHLIASTPQRVPDAVELARAARRIIRQNLFWAFSYNVVMIPMAAMGKLPPSVAAGAMMASSLTVVLNALRLPRKLSASIDRDGGPAQSRQDTTTTGEWAGGVANA